MDKIDCKIYESFEDANKVLFSLEASSIFSKYDNYQLLFLNFVINVIPVEGIYINEIYASSKKVKISNNNKTIKIDNLSSTCSTSFVVKFTKTDKLQLDIATNDIQIYFDITYLDVQTQVNMELLMYSTLNLNSKNDYLERKIKEIIKSSKADELKELEEEMKKPVKEIYVGKSNYNIREFGLFTK